MTPDQYRAVALARSPPVGRCIHGTGAVPAPRRPRLQRTELSFSRQYLRMSIQATRTRRPRAQQRLSLPHRSSFRHLGLGEEDFSGFRSAWKHSLRRAGEEIDGNYSEMAE
jgi:hypothetical protein